MKQATLIVVCLNFFFTTYLTAQTAEEEVTEKMQKSFVKSKLPGMGLAMVTKNGVLYQNGLGYADIASKKPFNISTVQNIGSISKTLIGVSLMRLVDQGKLNLDDPINNYLPFTISHSKFPKTPITIRHLATHSSGIRDTPSNYDLKSYYIDAERQKTEVSTKGFSAEEKVFLKKTKKNKRLPLGDFLKKMLDVNGQWYNNKNFYDFEPGSFYNTFIQDIYKSKTVNSDEK